jgi:tryptophan 7-halogenase
MNVATSPVRRVLVLGGGSAGFLAATTLKHRLPTLNVTLVRSPDLGIIGVGEGTTVGVPQHLHGYLNVPMDEFFQTAEPQWKLGIRFLWGERPFFDYVFGYQLDSQYSLLPRSTGYYVDRHTPWDYIGIQSGLMSCNAVFPRNPDGTPSANADAAYHLENETFVKWLEQFAARLGIEVIDTNVRTVTRNENAIQSLHSDHGELIADLFVDASGFVSRLLGQELHEPFESFTSTLFCDKAVVGGWPRGEEPIKPYTTAETMDAGWCWQIEHERRINRGYVYSSNFLSDEQADAEFRRKNPKVERTRIVRFRSGRYRRLWVDNVVAVGNAGGFVEPLESTSLAAICDHAKAIAETLTDSDGVVRPSHVAQFNKRAGRGWDAIRRFLGVHYKFNTRLDTPFWRACRADVDLVEATEFADYYRENGPSLTYRQTLIPPQDQFGMEGYLSMFVGMAVPYAAEREPTASEVTAWNRIRLMVQRQCENAVKVPEALATVRHPGWVWPKLY